ncbi:TRAP transporter small permease [Mitsuokella jalaludinii]|uniref:TRAP transporter small permease subunit n=1 Tax=Mitsuokella jalaludinii TaxID=187979 RepID=UPI003076B171
MTFKDIVLLYDRILGKVTRAAAVLAGCLLLITALIICYEIVVRDFFHSPTEWVLEVSTYAILVAGFLGLAVAFRDNTHVRVDIFAGRLAPETKRKLDMVINVISFLLFLIFMTESMDLVTSSYVYHKLSPSILRFPLFIPQFALVFGSLLLLGEIARRFLFELLRLPLDQDRNEHPEGKVR